MRYESNKRLRGWEDDYHRMERNVNSYGNLDYGRPGIYNEERGYYYNEPKGHYWTNREDKQDGITETGANDITVGIRNRDTITMNRVALRATEDNQSKDMI